VSVVPITHLHCFKKGDISVRMQILATPELVLAKVYILQPEHKDDLDFLNWSDDVFRQWMQPHSILNVQTHIGPDLTVTDIIYPPHDTEDKN
jgi:hypothetical protein